MYTYVRIRKYLKAALFIELFTYIDQHFRHIPKSACHCPSTIYYVLFSDSKFAPGLPWYNFNCAAVLHCNTSAIVIGD